MSVFRWILWGDTGQKRTIAQTRPMRSSSNTELQQPLHGSEHDIVPIPESSPKKIKHTCELGRFQSEMHDE